MSEEDSGLLVPKQFVGNDQPIEGVIHCGMSGDDPKIVGLPKSEVPHEERARRLEAEVDRLASLPVVEWMLYLPDVAEKYGVSRAVLKEMIEAKIKEREKKAREDKAENQQRERRVEKAQTKARREEERKRREQKRKQERADKEAERKRKEREKAFEAIVKLLACAVQDFSKHGRAGVAPRSLCQPAEPPRVEEREGTG